MNTSLPLTAEVSLEVIRTEQSGIPLYVGVAPAERLIQITSVDYYNAKLSPTDRSQGYQRPPERSRITKIGAFLMNPDSGLLFPTAIILSSRVPLDYDKREMTIAVSTGSPLQIVDGQHRLAGLKYAIEEKKASHLGGLPIPFVVMETPEKLTEMDQFRIINGTAKSVRTDLVNMILSALYSDTPRTEVPKKDQWRIVLGNVVDKLAKEADSPWRGQIALPGEQSGRKSGDGKVAKATSLITSLRPVYIWLKEIVLDKECSSLDEETDRVYAIVRDYWLALREVVPGAFESPEKHVIQKTPGLFSLHKLLAHLLHNMYIGRRPWVKDSFIDFMADHPEITDPDFWHVDEKHASVYGSMKGFEELYELLKIHYRIKK